MTFETIDDIIARDLVEDFGFVSTKKIQWGQIQYECDVFGNNLTWYWRQDNTTNGTVLQFVYTGAWTIHDFFPVNTESDIEYFEDHFIPWLLCCMWRDILPCDSSQPHPHEGIGWPLGGTNLYTPPDSNTTVEEMPNEDTKA